MARDERFVSWNGGWPRARDRIGDRRAVLNWTGDISSSVFSRNTSDTPTLCWPRKARSFSRKFLFSVYVSRDNDLHALRSRRRIVDAAGVSSTLVCFRLEKRRTKEERERMTSKAGGPAEYIL